MNIDQALQTYIVESRELLVEMESSLLAIDSAGEEARAELVNAIFRAAHTVKGSAGLFGLDRIVAFTHVVESVLDEVRNGALALDAALVSLLLACKDHIDALVTEVERHRGDASQALADAGAPLVERLGAYLGAPAGAGRIAATQPALPSPGELTSTDRSEHWHISLRFGPDVLRNGMDPLAFIRYLGTLGTVTAIATMDEGLPPPEAMDPETCYLGFEIAFDSRADKATIESVFDFVRDDCQLRILPPHSKLGEYLALIEALPEPPARLGDILVRCGALTERELKEALGVQAAVAFAPPLGEILVEQGTVQPAAVQAALNKQKTLKEGRGPDTQSIRVDADKLDHLINLVGELVIAAAGAQLVARATRVSELQESHSVLSTLVEQVRDASLQLRMVKIGSTFSRFQRVVRDVSQELGKDIVLQVSGEDTELDKTVVERIADPLTHLVRNAMDHGIEAAGVRQARGKPARGTVRLNAFHDSGNIVIEVGDDGGGLDRERILAKAVERGLVEPGRHMSDADIFALVFEPGFSTAEKITNLSGRGVGMDVVKRNITALRGSVSIASRAGEGTTVTVRLPLTLAIIDGFQVGVGRSVFVLPLDMVEECLAFRNDPDRDYTDLRGEVLPVIRLRELFGVQGPSGPRENLVVVKHAGQKAGLMVDALLGEAQTVIKPLSKMFAQVRGISGSSILGNGEVALILDVPALMAQAREAPEPVSSSAGT
ncbi:chemotaxis protein CheA [Ideonella sp. BN130291]|uniref:chemotaxis protein CheA n=1 Tax=Ideonella sp. BN130291 TaxID=3112940 RepID=UPI002E26CDF0|nr:chemotaxis protein CheA [Ideonella sp. BN130291]